MNDTNYEELLRKSQAFWCLDLATFSVPLHVIQLVDKAEAVNKNFLPMDFTDGCLTLVTNSLDNFSDQPSLLRLIQNKSPEVEMIKLRYAEFENIRNGFKNIYAQNITQSESKTSAPVEPVAEQLTTTQTKLVENIMNKALSLNASDIHITPYAKGAIVQYRVDGKLRASNINIDTQDRPYVINIFKAMAQIDMANKMIPHDGALIFANTEFRINTYPTCYDEKVNLRILNANAKLVSLDDMHFPDRETKILKHMVKKPYGIVLMTGPTGEGKSTTLYACMRERSPDENVILSAEDPVEQKIEGAAQAIMKPLEDNEANSFTFAKALRASLRQDPDVIFVGEVRDKETGTTAIQASQTGHLLFATLHCRSAIQSIQRMVDMGIDRNSFLNEMVCIISQRLVGVNCPHCRQKIISPRNEELREKDLKMLEEEKYSYASPGCETCNHTGLSGRIPIIEICEFDNAVRDYFSERRGLVATEKFLRKKGFRSLWDMGIDRVVDGTISLEELLSNLAPDDDLEKEGDIFA